MKPLDWSIIDRHLQGKSTDLIEVFFTEMDSSAWRRFFDWLISQDMALDCQYGRLDPHELSLEDFLSGKRSYMAYVNFADNAGLRFIILELDELELGIEIAEINSGERFSVFMAQVETIAENLTQGGYFVCREFQKQNPFIVDGEHAS